MGVTEATGGPGETGGGSRSVAFFGRPAGDICGSVKQGAVLKLLLTALFFVLCASPLSWAAASDGENSVQGPGGSERLQEKAFEQAGLKKLTGDRFILDLKYASQDNFLQQDVYSPFGLDACYVHPELHAKLLKLHDRLAAEGLRLVIYDCFRPLEVQRAMWKILPDARYVANPAKWSLHNRGIALDCALADENRCSLEFPTDFDSIEQTAWAGPVGPRDQ